MRAGLVVSHETGIADQICRENRGQAALHATAPSAGRLTPRVAEIHPVRRKRDVENWLFPGTLGTAAARPPFSRIRTWRALSVRDRK